MARRAFQGQGQCFFVDAAAFPQTIDVIRRAPPISASSWCLRPPGRCPQARTFRRPASSTRTRAANRRPDHAIAVKKARAAWSPSLRPDGAGAAQVARRNGRRHRPRLRAALRRADGLRRPARRLLRHARSARALDAGPHHRRLEGCARQDRLPHGAADPRAAHPPREGQFQHLHLASAAGQHRRHVRGVARPARPARIASRIHRLAACWPGLNLGVSGRDFFDSFEVKVGARFGEDHAGGGRRRLQPAPRR
jgi:hypothetical protein